MELHINKHQKALENLAHICQHSKEIFFQASQQTDNNKFKKVLYKYAEQRNNFKNELKAQINDGMAINEINGPLNVLNDLWMKVRTSFVDYKDDEKSILETIRSSEISILEAYDNELQGDILETDLKHLLVNQRMEISKAYNELEKFYFKHFPSQDNLFKFNNKR